MDDGIVEAASRIDEPVEPIPLCIPGKHVVVLSDLHVGSTLAIMPRKWTLMGSGHTVTASSNQQCLLQAFWEVVYRWQKPDILIILGDAIDGQAPADYGVTTWTTSILDEVMAAKKLIQLFEARHIYVLQGTDYHVSINGVAAEELLASELNAEFFSEEHRQLGIRSDKQLWLKVDDVVFHFAHPISSRGPNILQRELAEAVKHGANIAVRGHYHVYRHWETSAGHIFISPGWQLQTHYMQRKSPLGLVPDIGAIRFTVNGRNFGHEKLLFPTAGPQLTEVTSTSTDTLPKPKTNSAHLDAANTHCHSTSHDPSQQNHTAELDAGLIAPNSPETNWVDGRLLPPVYGWGRDISATTLLDTHIQFDPTARLPSRDIADHRICQEIADKIIMFIEAQEGHPAKRVYDTTAMLFGTSRWKVKKLWTTEVLKRIAQERNR